MDLLVCRIRMEPDPLSPVALQGKLVAEISRDDVRELIRTHVAEDVFVDFKQVIFHPDHEKPDDEIDDLLADLIAFANAFGGHIIVGIEDRGDHAWALGPINQAEARRIAMKLKSLAIQHIRPAIVPLEIIPFRMDDFADEWIVIIHIPEGQSKPHMSSFRGQTRFTRRDGNRKRSMTADEIQGLFLAGPQQSALASISRELQSVRALVEDSVTRRHWWQIWR